MSAQWRIGGVAGIVFGMTSIVIPILYGVFFVENEIQEADMSVAAEALPLIDKYSERFVTLGVVVFVSALAGIVFLLSLYDRVKTASAGWARLAAISGALAFGFVLIQWGLTTDAFQDLADEYAKGGEAAVAASHAYLALDNASDGFFVGFLFQALWLFITGLVIILKGSLPKATGYMAATAGVLFPVPFVLATLNDALGVLYVPLYWLIGAFAIWAGILFWRTEAAEGT